MVDGDGEFAGRRLRQAPVPVAPASAASEGSCSHAAATHPSNHSAIRSASAASRRHGLGRTTPRRELLDGGGDRVRAEQAAARWWALNAAPMCASSGSAGLRVTQPTTVSASSIGRPGARAEHPHQLVARQQVEQRRGGDEARPGEISRRQLRDVGPPRLDVTSGRGVGDGELQQGRRRGRGPPSAAARAAAARASVPSSRFRRRGRGSREGRRGAARDVRRARSSAPPRRPARAGRATPG